MGPFFLIYIFLFRYRFDSVYFIWGGGGEGGGKV